MAASTDGVIAMQVLLRSILFWESVDCLHGRWIFPIRMFLPTFHPPSFDMTEDVISKLTVFYSWPSFFTSPLLLWSLQWSQDVTSSILALWSSSQLFPDPCEVTLCCGLGVFMCKNVSVNDKRVRAPSSCFVHAFILILERSLLLIKTEKLRSPSDVLLNGRCGMIYHSCRQRRTRLDCLVHSLFELGANKTFRTFCGKGSGNPDSQNMQHALFCFVLWLCITSNENNKICC